MRTKREVEKHYSLIFTLLNTRAVKIESCPDLKTGTFLDAFRHFTCRQCHHLRCTVTLERGSSLHIDIRKSDNGASEELKKRVTGLVLKKKFL